MTVSPPQDFLDEHSKATTLSVSVYDFTHWRKRGYDLFDLLLSLKQPFQVVSLSYCGLGPSDVPNILRLLSFHREATFLHLNQNRLTGPGLLRLLPHVLRILPHLRCLTLSSKGAQWEDNASCIEIVKRLRPDLKPGVLVHPSLPGNLSFELRRDPTSVNLSPDFWIPFR